MKWMKSFVACLVVLFCMGTLVLGQEPVKSDEGWRVETVGISSGDSPIASGITGIIEVAKERWLVQGAFQHEQAWVIAGWKLGKIGVEKTETTFRGYAGLSAGHFQGAPWAGPYVWLKKPFSKNVAVSTLQWPGFFAWDPRSRDGRPPNPEWVRLGYVQVYQVDLGPLALFYSGLDYLDDPWNDLPGVSLTKKFPNTGISVSGSATRNTNRKEWMFLIGATWER